MSQLQKESGQRKYSEAVQLGSTAVLTTYFQKQTYIVGVRIIKCPDAHLILALWQADLSYTMCYMGMFPQSSRLGPTTPSKTDCSTEGNYFVIATYI